MTEQNRQWQTRQDGLDKVFQSSGPVPTPGDGEVLVRIKSVSLNYRDTEGGCLNLLSFVKSYLLTSGQLPWASTTTTSLWKAAPATLS